MVLSVPARVVLLVSSASWHTNIVLKMPTASFYEKRPLSLDVVDAMVVKPASVEHTNKKKRNDNYVGDDYGECDRLVFDGCLECVICASNMHTAQYAM